MSVVKHPLVQVTGKPDLTSDFKLSGVPGIISEIDLDAMLHASELIRVACRIVHQGHESNKLFALLGLDLNLCISIPMV